LHSGDHREPKKLMSVLSARLNAILTTLPSPVSGAPSSVPPKRLSPCLQTCLESLYRRVDASTQRVARLVEVSQAPNALHASQRSLAQVPEHASVAFGTTITFLLPYGFEKNKFIEALSVIFPLRFEGLHSADMVLPCALIPVGNHNVAHIRFHILSAAEGLQRIRHLSMDPNSLHQDVGFWAKDLSAWPCTTGLEELSHDFCSHSAALVYVVRPCTTEEQAERQLGPVCSVEAYRRSVATCQQQRRYLMVMHGSSEQCVQDSVGKDILSRLRFRAVAPIPCILVKEKDRKSLERLLSNVLEDLEVDFQPQSTTLEKMKSEGGASFDVSTIEGGSDQSSVGTSLQETPTSSLSMLAGLHCPPEEGQSCGLY